MGTGSPASGVILAIDLGLRRTGLARSDPERRVAFGLPTFELRPGRSLKAHLRALGGETPLSGVVLGLPHHAGGAEGTLAPRVRNLARWIRSDLGLPVAFLDESLTTEEARELLLEAPRSTRRRPGVRDRLAAEIILREFLGLGCPFPEEPEEQ